MPVTTIQEYTLRWLDGDDAAYRQVFDFYYPKLVPACYRSVRQREDCEEIVLNVFLNIWQKRQHLKHVEDFERYLFRCMSNQVSDFQRKRILQIVDIDLLPLAKLGTASAPGLSFKELQRIYQEALGRLPEKQRIIFLMSREQELSQKQIAEENNISVNTVNNHIKAAMKSLRRDMGEYSKALPVIILISSTGVPQ